MGLPEPAGPLWAAVKSQWDPWPPDDEEVADRLGRAWQQAADTVTGAVQQAGRAGDATLAAWPDPAGAALHAGVGGFGHHADLLQQRMRAQGALAAAYADKVRSAKQAITSVIAAYGPFYALLGNPLHGPAGQAMRAALVRNIVARFQELILGTAADLGLVLKASGPDAGFEASGPKDGKLGEVKAFADLFKLSAETADGTWKAETGLGAEAGASGALTNEGLKAQTEAAAGWKGSVEYKDTAGLVGEAAKFEAFAGGKAGASLAVTPQGFDASAEALAGAKAGLRLQGDVGGIGGGLTVEGWAGPGAGASARFGMGDDGKFHIGASAAASPLVGGKVGVDFAVDPAKVARTAGEVKETFDAAAQAVGRGVQDAYEGVSRGVQDAYEGAGRSVQDTYEDVGRGIQDILSGSAPATPWSHR